jgi:glycosyltransferase involved in cell wall biosynthesis
MLLNPSFITISIITAVKNEVDSLSKTIISIRSQTYKNIQYIIIDGGSTDGTLDLIKNNQDIVYYSVSEPDKGIGDAFNKGLRKATGDYIFFLGAGDCFYNSSVLSDIFEQNKLSETRDAINFINPEKTDLIAGKIMRVSEDFIPLWAAPKNILKFTKQDLLFKLALPHQGLFMHRRFFDKYGEFDIHLFYAMDYELLLRAYHDFPNPPRIQLVDKIIATWKAGGVGTGKIKEIYKEYDYIKRKNKIAHPMVLWMIDKYNRAKLMIKSIISIFKT